MSASAAPPADELTRLHVALLALTSGLAVASLYYVQPLLAEIADAFDIGTGRASLLVTGTQAGYVLGLALVVPLGDVVDRRRMITVLMSASAVVLGLTAAAPAFALLLVAMVAIGLTASAAMVAVPFGAALAHPSRRAGVTGSVMGGLLLGILLARTASGALAEIGSWRLVFAVAAALGVALVVLTRTALPADSETKQHHSYGALLASIAGLVRREPALRARMWLGALSMFSFSAMWTSLTFLLARDYGYSELVIGLFGLAGVAGAMGAPVVGRFADKGHSARATTIAVLCVLLGWGLLWAGAHVLVLVIVGILVFDFGVQGTQITNQGRIYQLDPAQRGRITTAYMVAFFTGAVLGSVASGAAYAHGGWNLVCGLGVGVGVVALGSWALFARRGW
ncbi:MFS transporter [Nocardioides acrostichi]|uniref:MFS transporter n=1 Tax=Nocardioides acrostichi TaxID=2784339 RepID=A0A930UUK3_9ACTN|nr:MFS transporter [Nocardioides acrostichi]MBF4161118.1 MFS transporter [Nocardioides acrostichi]